ncbi:MAG: hypothetical protein IPL32_17685 [Chloracidobacterium sp.]|nr:hypothetical protein [Chloracidobacterium sp.]
MFGLGHMDLGPVIYGVVIFLGLFSIWWKITHKRYIAAVIEITVFIIVFKLHGGSMAGGFAATVAALIAGVVIPHTLPKRWRS